MEEKKGINSMLEQLSPSQVFGLGIIEGLLVLCTVGFFILLSMQFGGAAKTGDTPTVVTPTVVQPTEQVAVKPRPVDPKVDHIRGNKDSDVSLIVYTDIECPYCKRFHGTMQEVMDKYGDQVRWVHRQFPLDSLHQNARTEAIATECAGLQGKFWEYTDLVFERTKSNDGLDVTTLPALAGELGLNVTTFKSCLDNKDTAGKVEADEKDAQATGGRGTPHGVIVGADGEAVVIRGAEPFASIEQKIQAMLK
ncbi:DsbA family protein [Patescibacteria group bacterium]|nr:DsbA family protein [Patescibacteria group bacterium]MBU1721926.1 DsbA family protein [Patescibacteria group bacterium]MBU1901547.1 DsbA family protein [Patescibacteria group bacterium]